MHVSMTKFLLYIGMPVILDYRSTLNHYGASQGMLVVKIPPTIAEDTRDSGSLGQEDPLEEEMATHSTILAWEIPWTEESGRL